MRTISSTAETARGLARTACLYGLKVTFPDAVGAKWYTSAWEPPDVDADDLRKRVLNWGDLSTVLSSGERFAKADLSVTIGDADGELRGWFEDHTLQGLGVVVYQALWTPGETEPALTDAVTLLVGTLVVPPHWNEGLHAFTFRVTDLSVKEETIVGVRATQDAFPTIDPADDGRVVQLVYGRPDRVKALLLNGGPRARLQRACDDDDTEIYVDDARDFPQGESIDLRIGEEIVTGSFAGNKFTATERGKILVTSSASHDSSGNCTIRDTSLNSIVDNHFCGWYVEIDDPADPLVSITGDFFQSVPSIHVRNFAPPPAARKLGRRIIRYDASEKLIEFAAPFVVEGTITGSAAENMRITGWEIRLRNGADYRIRTFPAPHDEGALVTLWDQPAEYAFAMGTCTAREVYVHGYRLRTRVLHVMETRTNYLGSLSALAESIRNSVDRAPEDEPDWVPLPAEFYTVDTTEIDGQTVSRVNLVCRPTALPEYVIDSDEILVDVTGPTSGGSVIDNPADVIAHIMHEYGGFISIEDLAGHWRLDEAGGQKAVDSSGNGNDGALSSGASFVPSGGEVAGAVEMDGQDGEVVILDAAQLHVEGKFTVAFRLKLDSATARGGISKKLNCDAEHGFQVFADGNYNRIRVHGSGSTGAITDAGACVTGTAWHSVAVTFDETDVQVYFDGQAVSMADDTITAVTADETPLRLGWFDIDADNFLDGRLDDVRLYDRLLSADEIALLAAPQSGEIDAADAAAHLANWHVGFAREQLTKLTDLVADLAFQARCRLRWLDDTVELVYLSNDGGAADLTLPSPRVVQDSVMRSREDLEVAASEVEVRWRENESLKRYCARDAGAEAALGRKLLAVECWAYQTRHCPEVLAKFLLDRSKRLHNLATVDATVYACRVEPLDIVDADLSDLFDSAPVPGEVQEAAFLPDRGGDDPDRVRLTMRQFRWSGCSAACEGTCETLGCESACESFFEPGGCWACESLCETACEAGCVTAAEAICDRGCETSCQTGCQTWCTATAVISSWGCGVCESDEAWWCDSAESS